ncbi:BTAD domain-containing putative transcriptional regulator [Actinoplanes sp. NPDC049681]|uniref:BTAD domain-containing putative transcriptional regulator n=1 Tax=Actinoplanes sp. NPDC049681 TaxID=3363905 RepID=UPI0037BD4167
MRVRLLGPVEVVRADGTALPVPGLRRRAVLAVLALRAGEVVSTDRLVEAVWGEGATTALNTVQSHVSYLRRALGDPAMIIARAPGYLLDPGPGGTDVAVAEGLIREARRSADAGRRVELLRSALALWRGRPLADVAELPWLGGESDRLAALASDARRLLVEARLALGQHADVLPELHELAREHPFDEEVQGRLVLALYRSGRQADALLVLREVRARLAAELGIDPGPALRDLEAAVLSQSPGLAPPPPPPVAVGGLLVGRGGELSALEDLLGAGGPDAAPMVAISGDPGIGKTSLLRQFARHAQRCGRTVAWGRAAEYEQHVPFAVITDALADLATPQGLPADDLALLHEILPMTGRPPGDTVAPALGGERFRLHRAVRTFLEAVAGSSGLVVVLDDLHWADPGSAELLDHLLRHPPAGPVLLAVSYRPRQLSGRLRQGLVRAVADGTVRSLELGPLAEADIGELLPAGLSGSRRHELYEASGGNPFYVQALARAVVSRVAPDRAGAPDALPTQVQVALAAELDALTPAEARVAWAAALAPEVAEPELVARTAELPVDEVLAALDRLVAYDILRVSPLRDRFQFRHPLLRRATYESADPGWRVAAHARAAEFLREHGAALAEQAHHLERCASRGDLGAVEVLRQAGAALLDSNPGVAGHWFGTAMRLLPDTAAAAGTRMELLSARAHALAVTGRLRESRQTLHDLLHLVPAAAAEPRASLVALCAGIERLLGRHAEANALLAAEVAALPPTAGRAAATLLLGLASDFTTVDDDGSGGRDPDRPASAVAAARLAGDRPLLAAALATSVLEDQRAGRASGDIGNRLTEAAALVDAMPDAEVAQLLHGVAWLATAELCQDRPFDAQRHAERALQTARSSGQTTLVGQIHALRACVHRALGDLPEAARCLEDARDAAALLDTDELTALVLAYQCTVTVLQGDLDHGLRLGKEAVAVAGNRSGYFAGTAAGALALALLHAGDPAGCVTTLLGDGAELDVRRIDPLSRSAWFLLLAQADAARGRPEQAMTWAERAQAEAGAGDSPKRTGSARLARAYALLPTDPAAAATYAEAALQPFAVAADPIGAGQAYLTLGSARASIGDIEGARAALVRARARFARSGAHLLGARAQRALVDLPAVASESEVAGAGSC